MKLALLVQPALGRIVEHWRRRIAEHEVDTIPL